MHEERVPCDPPKAPSPQIRINYLSSIPMNPADYANMASTSTVDGP